MRLLMERIARNQTRLTLQIDIVARPRELQATRTDKTEFVICDQAIDITYIRLRHSWLYLVVVLDWHARYVVSWQLDQTLAQPFVTWTVQQALGQATPEILTSDQGSHFTSPQYTTLVEAAGVRISMDGRGRALDTVFTERLWRTIKYEAVSLNDSATPREARMGLSRYFQFPNHQRVHQALGYRTPAEVYFEGERGSPLKPTVGWS